MRIQRRVAWNSGGINPRNPPSGSDWARARSVGTGVVGGTSSKVVPEGSKKAETNKGSPRDLTTAWGDGCWRVAQKRMSAARVHEAWRAVVAQGFLQQIKGRKRHNNNGQRAMFFFNV